MIVKFIGLVFNRYITIEIYSIVFFMYPWTMVRNLRFYGKLRS